MLSARQVAAYLDRIGWAGPTAASAEALRGLHHAHLLSVPFENLDIALGRPLRLETAALFAKVVGARRGGFCYELNGLFAALLRALGFDVILLAARVHGSGGFGPEFDHLCLLVRTPEPYLADVGFGECFREPLRLDLAGEQPEAGAAYRLTAAGPEWQLEQRPAGAEWEPAYRFTLAPRRLAAFAAMCGYHQTSPDSTFTQRRVCTRATPAGRLTYSGRGNVDRLIITEAGAQREEILAHSEAVSAALAEHFGVVLPASLPRT